MTPTQLIGLRNLIGAAPVVHDHDSRYYTETEADTRFLQKSTSALVNLINLFNESQEDAVRNKIEAVHDTGITTIEGTARISVSDSFRASPRTSVSNIAIIHGKLAIFNIRLAAIASYAGTIQFTGSASFTFSTPFSNVFTISESIEGLNDTELDGMDTNRGGITFSFRWSRRSIVAYYTVIAIGILP